MKQEDFEFDSIGVLSGIAEDLLLVEDNSLMKALGSDLLIAYKILLAAQKLQEGDYSREAYDSKILDIVTYMNSKTPVID